MQQCSNVARHWHTILRDTGRQRFLAHRLRYYATTLHQVFCIFISVVLSLIIFYIYYNIYKIRIYIQRDFCREDFCTSMLHHGAQLNFANVALQRCSAGYKNIISYRGTHSLLLGSDQFVTDKLQGLYRRPFSLKSSILTFQK